MSQQFEEYVESKGSWGLSIINLFENYGWYLLLLGVGVIYVYQKFKPSIDDFLKTREDREYAARYHKDPDLAAARFAAQQAAIEKLQGKHAKDAEEHKKKMEEKAEMKRQEFLAKTESYGGHKLGAQSSLRPEYNPLTGGGGHSYRPQRRSPCSGGGCGK